ncbi:NAD/NADP octopine/nopaline dehydrogenase family protein [Methanobrevibacter sp.]|uniref:NAD/NADP-dependent octopine/nopaline dehydrogenase family protein n=1 Tax=Methanobrevibacter sp. TaxID=66852 RepID=UPI00386E10F3
MKICVVGAGNIGLVLASTLCLQNKYEVVIYTHNNFDVSKFIFEDAENNIKYSNLDFTVETDMEKALTGADYVLCTYPAFLRKDFVEESKTYYSKDCKLGFFSGYGGVEYMCKDLVDKGVTIFGLQRVPFVSRQSNKEIATCLSRKEKLFIAAIPKDKTSQICAEIEEMIGIPTVGLNEYLAVTLVPSNPLLHLCGLYNVFKDYKKGDYFDCQLMFYDEWNDETSKLLLQYDDELQEICNRMKPLNLEEIVSLRTYYESPTAEAMTKKLKSIEAFKVVKVPLIEKGGKYFPDFDSRMFLEDFPYGIAIIKYFGILTNVNTPAIDKILKFYEDIQGICYFNEDGSFGKDFINSGAPANFGLCDLKSIIKYYQI